MLKVVNSLSQMSPRSGNILAPTGVKKRGQGMPPP